MKILLFVKIKTLLTELDVWSYKSLLRTNHRGACEIKRYTHRNMEFHVQYYSVYVDFP
jgi:hypothetical protein